MKTCQAASCTRRHHAKGYCTLHYQRLQRFGNPDTVTRPSTPEEAFRMYAKRDGDCLVWTGTKSDGGYGRMHIKRRQVMAHRWAYERAHGPIPEGLFIDHTCYNRACVDIEHLRLATAAENSRNRSGAVAGRALPRGVSRNGNGYFASVRSGESSWSRYFPTVEEADAWVTKKRHELFSNFAGRG